MELFERISAHPALLLIAAGVALGILVLIRALRSEQGERVEVTLPGLDAMLAAGRYRDAAMLCLRHNRLSDAQEYFLRANDPARAAQVAQRLGKHRDAAELYEKGGDLRRAAACFERVGNSQKAHELLVKLGDAPLAPDATTTGPQSGADAPARSPSHGVATPVRTREAALREMLARGPLDDASRVEMQQLAQQVVDEAIAAGEIRKGAELAREAGLLDEAVHLYATVLGQPGEAALLLSQKGNHARAAELFEAAGMKERAAAAWVDVARKADDVEAYVDRIERLEPRAAVRLLEETVATKPASRETAGVYYRLGTTLERLGERVRALEVMVALRRGAGPWKDVDARIAALGGKAQSDRPRGDAQAVVAQGQGGAGSSEPAATRQPTVVVQTFQVGADMNPEALQLLAREAVRAASPGDAGGATPSVIVMQHPMAQGLESAPLSLELLHDAAVSAAREGPSRDALLRFVEGRGCDLSNIEVYYRLGLVCLASGDWNAALSHFDAVEDASPGYRDAARRAADIRQWQSSMSGRTKLSSGILHGGGDSASRYTLHGELGRGGMAVVYRATDTVLGRDVALKFIADESLGKKELRDLFLREARAVAQLNHPNIVTIYDVGTLEGRTFIAMELVEGKTVDDLVVAQKKLPLVEALKVTAQVLTALEYAHGRSIVHRDVKPSNMMRAPGGHVKLMDFGLAKSVDGANKASVIAGTPAYMPPEQFAGEAVDCRADLYAVGASLYEMVTGELPFPSPLHFGPGPSVRALLPDAPEALDEALRVALESDPAKRYQSAKDFAAVVARALAEAERRQHAVTQAVAPFASAPTMMAARSTLSSRAVVEVPGLSPRTTMPKPLRATMALSDAAPPSLGPTSSPAPSASAAPPAAPPTRPADTRKQTALLSGPAQLTLAPTTPDPSSSQPRGATLMMHTPLVDAVLPAPTTGPHARTPTAAAHARSASGEARSGRKTTMMMGAPEAAPRRATSTIPPPM